MGATALNSLVTKFKIEKAGLPEGTTGPGTLTHCSHELLHSKAVYWSHKEPSLAKNHAALLQKVRPILDHNHDRLYRFKADIEANMNQLILGYLK